MPLPLAKLATPIAAGLMAMQPPPGRVEGRQRAMTRYVTLSKQATDAQVDFSTRIINACPPETRAGFARMLSRLDLDAVVERLDIPAVVVCGDRDRLTPIWHARRMAAALPQSLGLVTVPGAGHMTPVEAPRAVDGAVRRLVDGHLPAGPPPPATIDVTTTDQEIAR
jgi:pimeloyl-ACP methyl ester carboxylesterase